MDLAVVETHTKSETLNKTPTEDIISYGLLLLGESREIVTRIVETFAPPTTSTSIDIDDLIAEYNKEKLTEKFDLKRFNSLEEMCVGARGWKESCKKKKLEENTSDQKLLPGEYGRGVSLRELTLFMQELGAKNPNQAASFIKKIVETIRKHFCVSARLEELEIATVNFENFFKNFEKNERFLNYIKLVVGTSREAPCDSDSKRVISRFFGLDKNWQSKLKEITQGNAHKHHKSLVIFGKETCRDKDPQCNSCPFSNECRHRAVNVC